jgi:hypothetical protein
MYPGTAENLMFGKGIYFVTNPIHTGAKARHYGVMLCATVDIGRALILRDASDGRYHNFSPATLAHAGCGGVKGQSCPSAVWEYVVYDSWRVSNIQAIAGFRRG